MQIYKKSQRLSNEILLNRISSFLPNRLPSQQNPTKNTLQNQTFLKDHSQNISKRPFPASLLLNKNTLIPFLSLKILVIL